MDEIYRHLLDLARRAAKWHEPQFTRFLDPAREKDARMAAREAEVAISFFGGYPDAERRIARFAAPMDEEPIWPIACVKAKWNAKFASVGHRDLLGAMMGLGVTRERFGDIVVGDDCAYLFVMEESKAYLMANLLSAGRAKLTLSELNSIEELPEPKGALVRDTVSSMRLDALVAGAFSLRRTEAVELIERGLVRVNHVEEMRIGARLKEDDLVSARGYGRFRVVEETGLTRKGRIGVLMMRYGK